MPLTKLGARVLQGFQERYGQKRADAVFYGAMNKGTIDAKKMEKPGGSIRKRQAKEKQT